MKCYMYFPGKETGLQAMIAPPSLIFGDFQIDLKQEQHRSFYSVRVLILKNRKVTLRIYFCAVEYFYTLHR